MSKYHRIKCSREEAIVFKNKVKTFLKKENLLYTKILVSRYYDGQVKVFTGDVCNRLRIRQGRKLIAYVDKNGNYKGEVKAIEELKRLKVSRLWLKTSEPIEEKEYLPVYRVDNWEEEKQYLKEHLKQKGI